MDYKEFLEKKQQLELGKGFDVIERGVLLYTNPGEKVLTPFMGVGSEVVGALINNRKGIGIELKPTYYRQSIENIKDCLEDKQEQMGLFD